MILRPRAFALAILLGIAATAPVRPAESEAGRLDRQFQQTVRPFLAQYCARCHGTSAPAAQFDIRPYTNLPAVIADLSRWRRVSEKLGSEQMPPKVAQQPGAVLRQEVVGWIQAHAK